MKNSGLPVLVLILGSTMAYAQHSGTKTPPISSPLQQIILEKLSTQYSKVVLPEYRVRADKDGARINIGTPAFEMDNLLHKLNEFSEKNNVNPELIAYAKEAYFGSYPAYVSQRYGYYVGNDEGGVFLSFSWNESSGGLDTNHAVGAGLFGHFISPEVGQEYPAPNMLNQLTQAGLAFEMSPPQSPLPFDPCGYISAGVSPEQISVYLQQPSCVPVSNPNDPTHQSRNTLADAGGPFAKSIKSGSENGVLWAVFGNLGTTTILMQPQDPRPTTIVLTDPSTGRKQRARFQPGSFAIASFLKSYEHVPTFKFSME